MLQRPYRSVFRYALVLGVALGLSAGLSGPVAAQQAPATGAEDPVIAEVEGLKIFRSDFVRAFRRLPPEVRERGPEAVYASVLDRLIEQRLATHLGKEAGLAGDPEVQARLKLLESQVIYEVYVERLVRSQTSDAALREVYQEFLAMNPPVELVKARHLVVGTAEEARALGQRVAQGEPFADLARQFSTAPSASDGGNLGWFRSEEMLPEIAQAAFALQPNQFTADPVRTQYGWHIILVEDRRVMNPPDFDTIRPAFMDLLVEREVAHALSGLVQKANVKRFDLEGRPLQ
jgi:peptidyl-prolyl cis-trans isomerase C